MKKNRVFTQEILKKCDHVAGILGSLSHPVRLKVLCFLLQGEKRVSELTELCDLEQASMSQFLKRMKDDGLITPRRDKNSMYYSVADDRILKLMKCMSGIF